MSKQIHITISDEMYQYIKDNALSPSAVFKNAINAKRGGIKLPEKNET